MRNDKGFGSCPVCLGFKGNVLFSTDVGSTEYQLFQCRGCGLVRTLPEPDEGSICIEDIFKYYGKDNNKFVPSVQKIRDDMMRVRAKYYLGLIPNSVREPKILDVGCAEGRLLNAFLKYGCECWGIEHPSYPADRFINVNQIRYMQGELHTLNLPEEAFDLIFLWHVLEHMDNPQAVMSELYKLLTPAGSIILVVPNFSSLEARRFKKFWFHLDIPWHKYHFNERSINYLVRRNNCRIVRMSTLCLEQGPYGFIQSVLNAMGWPHNEFYEVLKGSRIPGRKVPLLIQSQILLILLIPAFLTSLLHSYGSRGSVLKLILKKEKTWVKRKNGWKW